jgi:2-amino-4-hydroxy-6-hydroxymethyldihydropteridine diphosphokinase
VKAWICLGSNLNEPKAQLTKAVHYLREKCFITVLREGAVVMAKPFGYANQPDFANQLLEIETRLSPHELLLFLKRSETELGRQPTFKWGPRNIDLDILFYEDRVIKSDELVIPHSGITEREYLLRMLNDIIPDYRHPELKKTISEIYDNFLKQGEQK